MASGRRGGPPDLKSTLGSLLRTTLDQVGAVKDVMEQQARSRGGLLDQALVQRRRRESLARLGEAVYRLSQRGELGELALDPEIGMAIAELDEMGDEDREHQPHMSASKRAGVEAVSSADYRPAQASPPSSGEYRVWRPVMPADDLEADAQQGGISAPAEARPAKAKPSGPLRTTRKSAQRSGGGIRFVEEQPKPGDAECDDDLASYMHDDDVPESPR